MKWGGGAGRCPFFVGRGYCLPSTKNRVCRRTARERGGSCDLRVRSADTKDFARIHRQYLSRLPGVRQMQTSFSLRTVVKTTALAV